MIETEYFRITETELQLLRSQFIHKRIPNSQLLRLELTKGSSLKYPLRTLLFGLSIIIMSTIFFFNLGELRFPEIEEINKGTFVPLVIYGFLLFIGGFAVVSATLKKAILKIFVDDGTSEVFPILGLRKEGSYDNLSRQLNEILPNKIHSTLA